MHCGTARDLTKKNKLLGILNDNQEKIVNTEKAYPIV